VKIGPWALISSNSENISLPLCLDVKNWPWNQGIWNWESISVVWNGLGIRVWKRSEIPRYRFAVCKPRARLSEGSASESCGNSLSPASRDTSSSRVPWRATLPGDSTPARRRGRSAAAAPRYAPPLLPGLASLSLPYPMAAPARA
jgi:hypothetical protein